MNGDARTRSKANRIRGKVGRMIREQTAWQGKRPEIIRLPMREYLIITEVGWADAWPGITIAAAP